MIIVWLVTIILAGIGNPWAIQLANWFGAHLILTILMLIFFG